MADECCDASEIFTAFLLNTCRLPPWLSQHRVQAALDCAILATAHPRDDKEAEFIPLITGSVAEFYMELMLPLVGDVDVMFYPNNCLAIPRGHPSPTHLPAEFHNYVRVFEIIDSHLPSYVYLPLRYLLSQRNDDSKYEYYEYDDKKYLAKNNIVFDETNYQTIHGPAIFIDNSHVSYLLSTDRVYCLRCLVWPPQAADWLPRHRNYGWPDSATLDRVVSNGCDVVGVAHRQCRQHEFMGNFQYRLSFSRAEIVLINSWMPVQQITYHLLRVYVKTERFTQSADNSEPAIMSNYHIKTLMLWACEMKPKSWWTFSSNLVKICVELLNTLSVWLTDMRCPHYFINSCNLLDKFLDVGSVARKLSSVHEEYLTTWYISHYVGQCAQLCPIHVSQLFGDVSTSVKLLKAVSEIVRWRLNTSLRDKWYTVNTAEVTITAHVSHCSLTANWCVCWINELTKLDERFPVFFSSVALLHVALKISRNGFDGVWKNILSTILRHNCSQCRSVLSRCKTELNTSELVELLQKSAVGHLTTYRQLLAREFGPVVTIVTTDIEALYAYKRGDNQRCLQLSTQNVYTLLCARRCHSVPTFPEFIQLMDDDIVSLTALTLIVNPECRKNTDNVSITQLTLSLYLMTQCQLKLHHSVTSLIQTLNYVKVAHRRHIPWSMMNQLTFKLSKRKVGIFGTMRYDTIRHEITFEK